MARTTAAAVVATLQQDYDTLNEPSLTPYINTANAIVNRVLTCAAEKEVAIARADLALMEMWLAAHFYQQSDKGYVEKTSDRAGAKFGGQLGMYLESTLYGQTAMMLDPSGCLAAINKRQWASGSWLGKTLAEQIDYDDRN